MNKDRHGPDGDQELIVNYDQLTKVMRTLALEAGDVIMEIYNSDDFDVQTKSDASPVTAADALISAGLREAFPDVPLVTEEQAESHDTQADTFLIVDCGPLGQVTVRTDGDPSAREGDRIGLIAPPERLHFFDADDKAV